jgi:hypothetical protein
MANFPTIPTSGKNSKIEISFADGIQLNLETMTKNAAYTYRGESYANRIYTLGTGKTLINVRPALQPNADIDGILSGLELSVAAAADQIAVSAGTIEVDGTTYAVSADAALALTVAGASKFRWNAITVVKSTRALAVVAGTETAGNDKAECLNTYGDSAGQRPLIPVGNLLIGWTIVGPTTYTVVPTDIDYQDREFGGIDYQILPNIGGVLLQSALQTVHSATTIGGTPIARVVKFSGYYLDTVMAVIGTAKSFTLTPSTTDVSDETFSGGYGQTEIGSWTVSFEQLLADPKVMNAALNRQGHCAIRLLVPNGYGWQSVATVAPTVSSQVGSMININVSGSLGDAPIPYTG